MKKITTLLLAILTCISSICAQYDVVYDFTSSSGTNPYGSLVSDGTFLYGMTPLNGAQALGTVFKINISDGTFSNMHTFDGSAGKLPFGALIDDGAFLYGLASNGGAFDFGTIFKINKADGTITKMHDFNVENGINPYGSLISQGDYLYGMTVFGGANNLGTIFKMNKDGSGFALIHSFNGNDGKCPYGALVSDGQYLYGMTYYGGANDQGVVFKISISDGSLTNIHDFNGTDGLNPLGSLIIKDGFLYGMTPQGGAHGTGNVFKMKTDGTAFMVLHEFNSDGTEGLNPEGSLFCLGDNLYAFASTGGAFDKGNIFKIGLDGSGFTVMHDFNGSDGGLPSYNNLIAVNNILYGSTTGGGIGDLGVVFKFALPVTTPVDLLSFTVSAASNGNLLRWQMADPGATDGFEIQVSTDGKAFTDLYFMQAHGSSGAYQFTDAGNYNVPVVFYRLKQLKADTHVDYSGVVSLKRDKMGHLSVFPNPANGWIRLDNATGNIVIFNGAGKVVIEQKSDGMKTDIDVRGLPAGIYFIIDSKGNKLRFIKQ